jgi:hypothetical protein
VSLESHTFLVADHGLFLPIARALAKYGHRVLYHKLDWQTGFPTINSAMVGDGFKDEGVECVPDIWEVKNQVDCFVFADIYHQGLQAELRAQGKRVWGSGAGMQLEIDRLYFMETVEKLGLDVAPYEVITGLANLRAYLKDKQDIYIKMSKFRGSFETKHFRNMDDDSGLLDAWAVRFGGLQDYVVFLCFDKIETNLEIGADTFCIDGKWPAKMLHGLEKKDSAFFAAVTEREKMPEELLPIMEAFAPVLERDKYRCQWSMEVRVSDEGNFFLDATCRGGLPSTGSQIMALDNLDEIIFYGAEGQLIEPQYNCLFTCETMVKTHGEVNSWSTIELRGELKEHLQVAGCCMVKDKPWFPPEPGVIEDEIGWLVATGNTPREALEQMNALADMLPDGADADVESLADIIREIESEHEQGIKFTDLPIPDADVVLEPS